MIGAGAIASLIGAEPGNAAAPEPRTTRSADPDDLVYAGDIQAGEKARFQPVLIVAQMLARFAGNAWLGGLASRFGRAQVMPPRRSPVPVP